MRAAFTVAVQVVLFQILCPGTAQNCCQSVPVLGVHLAALVKVTQSEGVVSGTHFHILVIILNGKLAARL